MCVRVARDHDRRTFGDAPVALPQMARVAPREIDQFFQRDGTVARSMVGGASPRSVGSGPNCKNIPSGLILPILAFRLNSGN